MDIQKKKINLLSRCIRCKKYKPDNYYKSN